MTTRVKSVILILATLVIGGLIGALVQAQLTERRYDRLESLRSQRGLARLVERSIEFESPEQREQVMEIIDEAAVKLFEKMRETRRESRAILDSTKEKLAEILTDEQMEKLEKRLTRGRKGRAKMKRQKREHAPDR